jgi:arabinan endo-1,5-alpha-L-arabinosidase
MIHMQKSISSRLGCGWLGMALVAALAVSGCGGGASSGSGGGVVTPPQTPDMGTLTTVNYTNQYTLKNAASGMVLGISGQSQTAGTNIVQEAASTTTADINWHFIPNGTEVYNIENMLTHQVLGVASAAATTGAQVVQWADNGTNDHNWQFYVLTDGNYLIKNVNSGYYLEDANSGTTSSATIDQGARAATGTGCTCQEWTLTSTNNDAYPKPIAVNVSYTAPDGANVGIHDPSMVKAGSTYYVFSTHSALYAKKSTDRINFTDDGFALSSIPSWASTYTNGDLWAPDASVHNGQYWLYYAASGFGLNNSAIGLAISPSGAPGTYVDSGAPLITTTTSSSINAIDPASVVDASGNSWLAFGSWWNGIQIVPVDNTTGKPTSTTYTQLAYHPTNTGIEGSYILYHGGFYYLFASFDNCCAGTSSTYRIAVGRSSNVNGPYADRGGVAMTQGGGTILLSAHDNIDGPGGQTVFQDTNGDIVLVYHYYDGNNNGYPALGLNLLGWTSDNWPVVQ